MRFGKLPMMVGSVALAGVVIAVSVLLPGGSGKSDSKAGSASAAEPAASQPAGAGDAKPGEGKPVDSVELTEAQAKTIHVDPVATHAFALQRTAVGSIDFNENRSVPVFTPYQGKIIQAFGDIGDEVAKGKTLFTIDSPDLVQAESGLIAAAGVYELTTTVLARAKELYATKGIAQKDLEQAVSDQQTAEGALKAAREAVRVFGKSDAEIDAIVAKRKIDPALVVPSPVSGRITARVAQPGLLVQPGNAPAPFTISDVSSIWMLANVAESDSPDFHLGQQVRVKVMALPQRVFEGKITAIGETVDPSTHTMVVRSELRDPKHELRPGMLATFVIRTGDPVSAVAVPQNGVVREGDGTMSVWVTTDRRHFTKRTVKVGLQQDGLDQISEGLQAGELVATDGAIFLSNMLVASPES
jgi:cobalt-zinc-cadmium efflux system membrane fusion protein